MSAKNKKLQYRVNVRVIFKCILKWSHIFYEIIMICICMSLFIPGFYFTAIKNIVFITKILLVIKLTT